MIVRIRDRAPAFDPRLAPVPRLDLPLGAAPARRDGDPSGPDADGRVRPPYPAEGGNEVTVTKDLRPTETRG